VGADVGHAGGAEQPQILIVGAGFSLIKIRQTT
jgi:hypothetical protein